MATKMLVCPECESAVAPGRFACASCGAMLASVASAPRSLSLTESMASPSVSPGAPAAAMDVTETDTDSTPDPHEVAEGLSTIGPAWAHGPLERAPGETDLDFDEDAPLAAEVASTEAPGAAQADADAADTVAAADPMPHDEPVAETGPAEELAAAPDVESSAFANLAVNEARPVPADEPVADEAGVEGD
jgi:hypothetical protein